MVEGLQVPGKEDLYDARHLLIKEQRTIAIMALANASPAILDAVITHEKAPIKVDMATLKAQASSKTGRDQVRIVRPEDYKEAAACLAEAFREDNVVRYPGL